LAALQQHKQEQLQQQQQQQTAAAAAAAAAGATGDWMQQLQQQQQSEILDIGLMGLDAHSLQAHSHRRGLDETPADGGMGLQPLAERPMAINNRSMHTVSIYGGDLIGVLQLMAERPPMAINSLSIHAVAIYGENLIGLQPMRTRFQGVMILARQVSYASRWRHELFPASVGGLVCAQCAPRAQVGRLDRIPTLERRALLKQTLAACACACGELGFNSVMGSWVLTVCWGVAS